MVYIYKMHAGTMGTEETFWSKDKVDTWECAVDHAQSYGNEQDEYGEWSEGCEPECWLDEEVKTLAELEPHLGFLLVGGDTEEELLAEMAKEGIFLD